MIYSVCVSFAVGIIFEKYFGVGLWGAIFIALLFFIASVFLYRGDSRRLARSFILAGVFVLFGIARMVISSPDIDPLLASMVGEDYSFQAEVVREPDKRESTTIYVVKAIESENDSYILVVAHQYPEFKYNDLVSVTGKIGLPKNFELDNGEEFDYVSFLMKDQIHFQMFRPKIELIESRKSFRGILFGIKNQFIDSISKIIPDPDSALVAGLLFGSKQSLGDELLNKFKIAGIIHIIVLSGYNITLVANGFLSATSYIGKRKLGYILGGVGIVLFGLMVGLGATVLRAIIMAMIGIWARHLGRPFDALRALFVAGFAMLVFNPLLLTNDPSFQLSFMATFGLITITPIFYTKLNFTTPKYGLREMIASTLAVQIFLLPLLIKMSGFVSVVSFFVNIIVPPLVPLAMLFGFATGLLALLPSYLSLSAWVPGLVAFMITRTIIFVAEISSSFPFSIIEISPLPFYIILAWYALYLFIYFRLAKNTFHSKIF